MIDKTADAARWTKEKLLQTSGDLDFLTEKVTKWVEFEYLWKHHAENPGIGLTDSIQENLNQGTTLEEWLNIVYSPLDATILASAVCAWEWIDPLLNGAEYHEASISLAIGTVNIDMVMADGAPGAFIDICEPDRRLFPHDVTLLDIINILDREVAKGLYGKDEQQARDVFGKTESNGKMSWGETI